ncbi:MAG: hypothetical protein H6658_20660 [Ardenticatenaceae bacterium]|nr:hypothetical protein [Ardenticatenaceae bacterium]
MNKDARVSWFTFWTFVFSVAFCWALLQAWATLDARWLAVSWGAIVAMIMLVDRKRQHDELCLPSLGIYTTESQGQKREVEYKPTVQSENGQRIRYAKFALTRAQWANLAHEIDRADGRVIRDVVARANVFTNLTGKWPEIVREFERLGWVENGGLTDAGKEFMNQFLTPPPHSK